MKFSIVTISYNQINYLSQCIESVLSQKEFVEYIIVDPGSTDGSRELIKSYGGRVKMVFQSDLGPADGLNNGFEHATGDIFGFINADDYLLPNALSSVRMQIEKTGSQFLSGKGLTLDKDRLYQISPSVMTIDGMLYRSSVVFQPSTFFHRNLYVLTNGFNAKNKTCWDYELFLDLLRCGAKHTVFKDEIAVFRIHDDSISGSGRLEEEYKKELNGIYERMKKRKFGMGANMMSFIYRCNGKINRLLGNDKDK